MTPRATTEPASLDELQARAAAAQAALDEAAAELRARDEAAQARYDADLTAWRQRLVDTYAEQDAADEAAGRALDAEFTAAAEVGDLTAAAQSYRQQRALRSKRVRARMELIGARTALGLPTHGIPELSPGADMLLERFAEAVSNAAATRGWHAFDEEFGQQPNRADYDG